MKDAKYTGVRDEIPRQVFFAFMENDTVGGAVIYVRTTTSSRTRRSARCGRSCASSIRTSRSTTCGRWIIRLDQSLLNDRLIATLSTAFGVLATLLAVIGLYGVMAYTVARRTREIGVRMALGAVPGDVIWLVMREVLLLVGSGLGARTDRVVGARTVRRQPAIRRQRQRSADDGGGLRPLAVVAALAGYVPARRATRVNPVLALRYE